MGLSANKPECVSCIAYISPPLLSTQHLRLQSFPGSLPAHPVKLLFSSFQCRIFFFSEKMPQKYARKIYFNRERISAISAT